MQNWGRHSFLGELLKNSSPASKPRRQVRRREKAGSVYYLCRLMDQNLPGAAARDRSEQSQVDMDSLISDLQTLRSSRHPLAPALFRSLATSVHIAAQLLRDNQELSSHQTRGKEESVQADPQGQRRSFRPVAKGSPDGPYRRFSLLCDDLLPLPVLSPATKNDRRETEFSVQVQTSGRTNGCEKHFVDDVSRVLSDHGVSLRVEHYKKTSESFLLIFCPIALRKDADIERALEGLGQTRKAILVILHLKAKDSGRSVLDSERQVTHPALVRTVHACFTLQDGLYACKMNEAAVAAVADVIRSCAQQN